LLIVSAESLNLDFKDENPFFQQEKGTADILLSPSVDEEKQVLFSTFICLMIVLKS
jgi:hypothetical protein